MGIDLSEKSTQKEETKQQQAIGNDDAEVGDVKFGLECPHSHVNLIGLVVG